jgi:UDP-N-acetylglucosamine 2-epimerase (non-hydrolysing)
MSKIKILIIFGTRPEAIKFAPLILALHRAADFFETRICDTGQHLELKQPILGFFQIQPHYNLNALGASQSLSSLTTYLLYELPNVINDFSPDWIIVQGDTTSAMAGSLAGFYTKVKVAHLEAGLRTHEKWTPYPEEMNRQLISRLADLHFAPTAIAMGNLIQEGIPQGQIHLVGNTVVDALHLALEKIKKEEPNSIVILKKELENWRAKYPKMILFTLHRRENLEENLPEITLAMEEILQRKQCFILFPAHLNPRVRSWAAALAIKFDNLLLIEPLAYEAFIWAMQTCDLIMTDSGGIQEEAPTLGKPVIVLRATTERPEARKTGIVHQVSINKDSIVSAAFELLQYPSESPQFTNPFGDGNSATRILAILRTF